MPANTGKVNIASLRVLRTLACLFDEELTMKELVSRLNQIGPGSFNNFVVSKYINTCKSCGIDIQKLDNKYTIINFPIGMKFSAKESKLLFEIKTLSENIRSDTLEETIENFMRKLHLVFFKSSNGLPSSSNFRIIKIFERACLTKCDIQLFYKDNTSEICSPKEIFVVKEKILFKIYNNVDYKEINPDKVLDIKILSEETEENAEAPTVIYELRGKLARRYQPREHEQIIQFKRNGAIVISNRYENKDQLLHRLLRYDVSCKLLKPKAYVSEMKELINKSLANYE
ncbi:MAG: hypothetical protein LUB59_04260 [Candidatus Gastranaerophilales bacterium]|nr:hypothetical protein [Candidatus Gastranaerophilales bacterium]